MNLLGTALLAATAAVAASAAAAAPAAGGAATRSRVLMGTAWSVEAQAEGGDDLAARAAQAALDEVERLESVLSTWRSDSEMARANEAARGGVAPLSPELASSLRRALDHAALTGGAFDPCVGALVDAWDLRGAGRIPAAAGLRAARAATGLRVVRLDGDASTLAFTEPAAWIDTGGFGKGLALDRAADVLRAAGAESGFLDAGGQVLVVGTRSVPVAARRIGVADPRDRDRAALSLELESGSASTSAQSERFAEAGGRRLGHVVDPRTGRPVRFAGSATVIAPSALDADALSTALLVMGPRDGLAFARERGLVAGFLVPRRDGLELVATRSFLALVRETAPGVLVRSRAPAAPPSSLRRLR